MPQGAPYGLPNENFVSTGGQFNTAVAQAAIAAGVTVIKAAPGRLARVLVSVTTAGGSISIYDNASTGSGNVIGVIPAATAAGTMFDFEMPATNGITVGQNAAVSAGSVTISWM